MPDLFEFYKHMGACPPPDALSALEQFVRLWWVGVQLNSNELYGNGGMLKFSAVATKEAIRKLVHQGLLEEVSSKRWKVKVLPEGERGPYAAQRIALPSQPPTASVIAAKGLLDPQTLSISPETAEPSVADAVGPAGPNGPELSKGSAVEP